MDLFFGLGTWILSLLHWKPGRCEWEQYDDRRKCMTQATLYDGIAAQCGSFRQPKSGDFVLCASVSQHDASCTSSRSPPSPRPASGTIPGSGTRLGTCH